TLHTAADGLVLDAIPLGRTPDGTILRAVVPGIRAISIQLLEAASARDGAQWRSDWPLAASRPAAVAITLDDGSHPPLVVSLDPLQELSAGRL
ncbi:MAG: hypothetical protein WCK74_10650, partial [Gemmatimonadaceae bacterium]